MTSDAPRIVCDRCKLLMPSIGYTRCASCELGPSFSATSAGARAAIEAHGKRKRLAVVRDGVV